MLTVTRVGEMVETVETMMAELEATAEEEFGDKGEKAMEAALHAANLLTCLNDLEGVA